ncbi:ABC transporter permease [Holzapfeliella sp. He02]|uniref:Transport permease protein n=1 Tax=Holzapfeliella saturejae TaxID=3082953 RepID=A0ABU8SGJ3_9LACO
MNPMNFRHHSLGVKSILIVASNEWKAFRTNKGLLLSMFMQPLMLYGLLVSALGLSIQTVNYQGIVVSYAQYALIGIFSFFMTTQMSQAMYRSSVDKQFGLLAIKFMNGVQPWHYLTGMSFFPSIGFIFQCSVLLVLGLITGGIYQIVYFLLAVLFGIILLEFWSSLGILLSTKISDYQKRDLVMTLIFTPISYAAPTLYVLSDNSPILIKLIAAINPLTYQLNALRSIAFGIFDLKTILISVVLSLAMVLLAQSILKRMKLTLAER